MAVILAAVFSCNAQYESVIVFMLEQNFSLPSNASEWTVDEASWLGFPGPGTDGRDILTKILAGEKPCQHIGEFGLLVITAALICRISSFQSLLSMEQPEAQETFMMKMRVPLQILDEICGAQFADGDDLISESNPLTQCTYFLINSAWYHLDARRPLERMTAMLKDPPSVRRATDLNFPPVELGCAHLGEALIRAAKGLRRDCRLGISYLHQIAPHKFSPLCVPAICEAGGHPSRSSHSAYFRPC